MIGLEGPGTGSEQKTWSRCCCSCRHVRLSATAAVRRWTPTVFCYVMLVSIIGTHFLHPVWAATRPPSFGNRSVQIDAVSDTASWDGGGNRGGFTGGYAFSSTLITDSYAPGRDASKEKTSKLLPSPSGDETDDDCRSWGAHVQELLQKRSAVSGGGVGASSHPHRQHASSSRHYQPYPAPSLASLSPSLPYQYLPSSSLLSSASSFPSSPSEGVGADNRGLPVQLLLQDSQSPEPKFQQQQRQSTHHHHHQLETQRELRDGVAGKIDFRDGTSKTDVGELSRAPTGSEIPCETFNISSPPVSSPPRREKRRFSLTRSTVADVCTCPAGDRVEMFRYSHLSFCSSFPTNSVLSCTSSFRPQPGKSPVSLCQVERNRTENEDCICPLEGVRSACIVFLERIVELDELVQAKFRDFQDLLSRYDCNAEYSVRWKCQHCERAYKEWLCAALIPYYVNGFRVQPCSTYCRQVEMMCPFFRPKTETHFGDPSFICKDPGMKNGLTEDDGDYIKPCFQMCHVVSADDIRNAFCHPDNVTCPGLDHELKECPKLLDYFLDAQNSTGLLGNATSSVAGSVMQGHVSRTASVIAQLLWVGVVLIGAEQHCLVVQAVMTILLLSVILTACPYTSIGLT